jgi:heterodisulfide reductase subunit A
MEKPIGAALVLGGGIAGMQASLDLADSGYKVYLIDKSTAIGGTMSQLDKTFPTNDCSMCIMSPKLVETGRHPNIHILTNTELEKVEGTAGNFKVTVKQTSNYIINDTCTGCGTCAEVCPIEVENDYNANIGTRKATYLRYPQAIPKIYTIDQEACIGCGLCQRLCPAKAIDYSKQNRFITLDVGSIIIAVGAKTFDPSQLTNYGYGTSPNILSSIEFERVLSASGPFMGHVLRPSDGMAPKKIAFIQCVGSRDRKINRAFCSAACCMYAMKEAIIAREHNHDLDITIFYMDIRAFGKGFEDYYNRAKEMGIRFIRSRPSSAQAKGNQVEVIYEDNATHLQSELFDMLVLSIGFDTKEQNEKLKQILGIELNQFGFIQTTTLNPLETNVDGIYACGVGTGPKDIPDTVAQASGAAAKAGQLIHSARGTLVSHQTLPPEVLTREAAPKIGVFICHCGINIGSTVDVPKVVEYAKKLPDVVYAERNLYTCSQDTQEKMKEIIQEKNINRVVVASCTPRTHEPLFQNTIRQVGLNKYLFQLANIREQDAWVHMGKTEEATEKAKGLVNSAVSKTRLLTPISDISVPVTPAALVIGGGIAGISAALGLGNQGYKTYLIEKTDQLGGIMRRIHYLNADEEPQDHLKAKIEELKRNNNIELYFNSELIELEGFLGNFIAKIKQGEEIFELNIGAIIVATGAKEHNPTSYLYGKNPSVVTELELEDLISSNQIQGKNFVFIQCVGSRDEIHPYCSRICCTEAMKNATKLKSVIPDANIYVLYRDIRTYGFKETFYENARDLGIFFINFDPEEPPIVYEDDQRNVRVSIFDKILQKKIILNPDYVILSVGVEPIDNSRLSESLKVPLNQDGFYLEAHLKLRPVDFASEGIFVCGLAHSPKFLDETIAQAEATVARALTILTKDEIEIEGIISHVNEEKCVGCQECVSICPFDAITFNEQKHKVEINPVKCHGCGLCAGECPEGAMELNDFLDKQFYAQIENIFKEENV